VTGEPPGRVPPPDAGEPGGLFPALERVGRTNLAKMAARAFATAAALLLIYFIVPIERHPGAGIALRLGIGMAAFVGVLALEVSLISTHDQPILRAAVAMATIIPLFLVVFAWIYLTMARSDPHSFGTPLDRVGALYFTVSVFSTVGFGDITAKTDAARVVVTFQMLADMVVVAVVIRLILGAATRTEARRRTLAEHAEQAPGDPHGDTGSADVAPG